MFTGLVEEVGESLSLFQGSKAMELRVRAGLVAEGIRLGDSVAVNGCCLTVSALDGGALTFELLEETLQRTNLHAMGTGAAVNLERALPAEGRLGGHFVQGHIDCVTEVLGTEERGGDLKLAFALPEAFARYVAWKGSIAVNGVSLTVAELEERAFAVWIIPHTRSHTNLGRLRKGGPVNLEFDILAKYAERILGAR